MPAGSKALAKNSEIQGRSATIGVGGRPDNAVGTQPEEKTDSGLANQADPVPEQGNNFVKRTLSTLDLRRSQRLLQLIQGGCHVVTASALGGTWKGLSMEVRALLVSERHMMAGSLFEAEFQRRNELRASARAGRAWRNVRTPQAEGPRTHTEPSICS